MGLGAVQPIFNIEFLKVSRVEDCLIFLSSLFLSNTVYRRNKRVLESISFTIKCCNIFQKTNVCKLLFCME